MICVKSDSQIFMANHVPGVGSFCYLNMLDQGTKDQISVALPVAQRYW